MLQCCCGLWLAPHTTSQPTDVFKTNRILDREDDYRRRRLNRVLSPERTDAFALGDRTPDARVRTYADTMKEAALDRERDNTMQNIRQKQREEAEADEGRGKGAMPPPSAEAAEGKRRKDRWDGEDAAHEPYVAPVLSLVALQQQARVATSSAAGVPPERSRTHISHRHRKKQRVSAWDSVEATPAVNVWDATPAVGLGSGASRWEATPGADAERGARWEDTPSVWVWTVGCVVQVS